MKTFEEFVDDLYPDAKLQYEMYCMSDEELIGQKVISIRGGYSSPGGTKMIISKILPPCRNDLSSPEYDRISFIGRDGWESKSGLGWQTLRKDLITSVKLDK